jgi:hypothetical protein
MPAVDLLSFRLTLGRTLKAQKDQTGKAPLTVDNALKIPFVKAQALSTDVAASAVGGADVGVISLLEVAPSGTYTVNLKSVVDVLGQTLTSMVRLKYLEWTLVSVAQATAAGDISMGSACTQVTIGNAGANAHQTFLGADTHTVVLTSGRTVLMNDPSGAGLAVDATNRDILITNNDAAAAAKVLMVAAGGSS